MMHEDFHENRRSTPPAEPPMGSPTGRYVSPASPCVRSGNVPPSNGCTPPSPRPKLASDRRDVIGATVLLIFSVLAANWSLYGGFRLGYAVAWLAITVWGIFYCGKNTLRPHPYAILCLTAATAGLGIFFWHEDGLIKFSAFCGMLLLTLLALCDATGRFTHDSGRPGSLLDAAVMLFRPFNHLGDALPALFRVKKNDTLEKRRCGGVFIGLLCAIPALVIILPLLIHADAAFAGLMELTILDNIGELLASLSVGLLLFAIIFTCLFSLRHQLNGACPPSSHERKGADALAVNVFLSVIGVVYLLYLFSQLFYFVSAFSGILPEDFTVAEYARRGFFEMCAICAINLGLVALVLLISRKPEAPRSTRGLLLFILLFSLVLVATAMSKMVLYVGSFGMTRLRVMTSLFMVMLAVVILLLAVRLFVTGFPYMRIAVLTLAVLGLAIGYLDVDTQIANYNVAAYQNGRLEQIDVDHLAELSDGAVPALFSLLEDDDPTVVSRAAEALQNKLFAITKYDRKNELQLIEDFSLRSFSIDRHRSHTLLWENRDRLLGIETNIIYQSSPLNSYNYSFGRYQLANQIGHHYDTQTVEFLGSTDISEIYYVYDPEKPCTATWLIDGYCIQTGYESRPHQHGLYAVMLDTGDVYPLDEAYDNALLDISYVYNHILPDDMKAGYTETPAL